MSTNFWTESRNFSNSNSIPLSFLDLRLIYNLNNVGNFHAETTGATSVTWPSRPGRRSLSNRAVPWRTNPRRHTNPTGVSPPGAKPIKKATAGARARLGGNIKVRRTPYSPNPISLPRQVRLPLPCRSPQIAAFITFVPDDQASRWPRYFGHGRQSNRNRRSHKMGKRLTRIYTRTGDDGTTGLGNGLRSGKESLRIEAIGAVDELNSHIGVLL